MTKSQHYMKQTILHIIFLALIAVSIIPILYAMQVSFSGKGCSLAAEGHLQSIEYRYDRYSNDCKEDDVENCLLHVMM